MSEYERNQKALGQTTGFAAGLYLVSFATMPLMMALDKLDIVIWQDWGSVVPLFSFVFALVAPVVYYLIKKSQI